MAEHVDPAKVKDLDAAIHFVITTLLMADPTLTRRVFKDGAVTVGDELNRGHDDRGPVPFLKLVTARTSARRCS